MRDGCDGPTMGRGRVPYPLKDEPIEAPKKRRVDTSGARCMRSCHLLINERLITPEAAVCLPDEHEYI